MSRKVCMEFKIPPRKFQNESSSRSVTFRLPKDMVEALEKASVALQYKKTEIVAMLLDRFLQDLMNDGTIQEPQRAEASSNDASDSDNESKR